jgi:hypothetical protein
MRWGWWSPNLSSARGYAAGDVILDRFDCDLARAAVFVALKLAPAEEHIQVGLAAIEDLSRFCGAYDELG